jgi:hypothetical protein
MTTSIPGFPPDIDCVKAQAKRLRAALPSEAFTHAQALEIVAKLHGAASWGAMRHALEMTSAPMPSVADVPSVTSTDEHRLKILKSYQADALASRISLECDLIDENPAALKAMTMPRFLLTMANIPSSGTARGFSHDSLIKVLDIDRIATLPYNQTAWVDGREVPFSLDHSVIDTIDTITLKERALLHFKGDALVEILRGIRRLPYVKISGRAPIRHAKAEHELSPLDLSRRLQLDWRHTALVADFQHDAIRLYGALTGQSDDTLLPTKAAEVARALSMSRYANLPEFECETDGMRLIFGGALAGLTTFKKQNAPVPIFISARSSEGCADVMMAQARSLRCHVFCHLDDTFNESAFSQSALANSACLVVAEDAQLPHWICETLGIARQGDLATARIFPSQSAV